MSAYDLRPVTTDDATIAKMTALLRAVFPDAKHFTEDVLRWQYRENPNGEALGFNAWSGDELVAHYVTIPLVAMVHGKEERGLLSLNTATHPSHQGKGLFTKLANSTYERGARQGFGFVIGVANANSTHGFTKKLDFQLVSPLRAMIGIGPLPLKEGPAGTGYEQLWTERAFTWRLSHPAYTYEESEEKNVIMVLSERSQSGCRYVLFASRHEPGKDRVESAGISGNALKVAILDVAQSTRASRRKVWIGLDPAMEWSGSLYVNIPMRFRPSPLNLIFKDLSGAGRMLDPTNVRFHAIDFDIL